MSRRQTRQAAALASLDANRILWLFDRRAAYALFVNGLNATAASSMDDSLLLIRKGIGQSAVNSIRKANNSAKGVDGGFTI